MTRFAFVVHPLTPKHAAKRYPAARYVPDPLIEWFLRRKKPLVMSEITGIESITGAKTTGCFIACPLTPSMMVDRLPLEFVYERIVQCAELAQREGAKLIGLGAFTSVVGDGGITVAKRSPIAVTTGNSYTVATAIEGALKACALLDLDISSATLAVVGATGSIGKTCGKLLADRFRETILIGRDANRTQKLASDLPRSRSSVSVDDLREADVVIAVTSSDSPIILPEHLKPGSVVCDVARPRDVSYRVARERPDVLVIEGGVVSVPGDVKFGLDFGFPPKTAYACMSETIMLALEDRTENFTLGKDVSVAQVEETLQMAKRHGFSLAGFRSFERAVTDEAVSKVRAARRQMTPA